MKRTALGPGAKSLARGSTFAAPPTPLDRRSQLERHTKLPPVTKDAQRREDRQGRTVERERRFAGIALWLARVSYVAGFVPEAPPEVPGVDASAPEAIASAAGAYVAAKARGVRLPARRAER